MTMRNTDRATCEGSVLIEAIVGIGLLAILSTSIAGIVPVALDAAARAEVRTTMLVEAERLLESVIAAGDTSLDGAPSGVPCDRSLALAGRHRSVVVEPSHPRGGDPFELAGLVVPDAAPSVDPTGPARSVRLRLADSAAMVRPMVTRGPGVERVAVPGPGGGCVDLAEVEQGLHRIDDASDPDVGAGLIDRTHVPLAERPRRVTLAGADLDVVLDVTSPGTVRVTADSGGARTADVLTAGPLLWSVRGDDAARGTALGEARTVHPGDVTVVVSACPDAEAQASARQVHVGSGEEVDVIVPLVTVTVEGVASHPEAMLFIARAAACADGRDVRPALAWDGGLRDGMRIALPRGAWDASLRVPETLFPLTEPVRLLAVEPDASVIIR